MDTDDGASSRFREDRRLKMHSLELFSVQKAAAEFISVGPRIHH
jgi:hypothetical protein